MGVIKELFSKGVVSWKRKAKEINRLFIFKNGLDNIPVGGI